MTGTPQYTYINTQQFSELTGETYTVSTIETYRSRRPEWGPPIRRLGGRILYRLDEVLDWIESHRVEPGEDRRPATTEPEGLPQPYTVQQYREWRDSQRRAREEGR